MKIKVNLNTMHYTQFVAHLKSKEIFKTIKNKNHGKDKCSNSIDG